MKAAGAPRGLGPRQPMLVVDPLADDPVEATIADLPRVLPPGTVVVINDAATIPASLPGHTPAGEDIELRLSGSRQGSRWGAVLMGGGDWRTDTDARPAPSMVRAGDRLRLPDGSAAIVRRCEGRHVEIDLLRDDDAAWALLYTHGRAIQYAYAAREMRLADVQTPFAARPFAVEMPSAGRPLSVAMLLDLRRRGVVVTPLTHAAGLSATGDVALDAALPLPESYELPAATVDAIARARRHGDRVLAIGTSVVRSLEGAWRDHGRLGVGPGTTSLVIGPGFVPHVVDGLLSGIHEPGTSHHDVLAAFAPPETLARADRHAAAAGLLVHEFGDSTLVWPGAARALAPAKRRTYCAA